MSRFSKLPSLGRTVFSMLVFMTAIFATEAAPAKDVPAKPAARKTTADGEAFEKEVRIVLFEYLEKVRFHGVEAGTTFLSKKLSQAKPPVRPILAVALADAWDAYYTEHLAELLREDDAEALPEDYEDEDGVKPVRKDFEVTPVAKTGAAKPENAKLWGARRVRAEIRNCYEIAFADSTNLRSIPVSRFHQFFSRIKLKPEEKQFVCPVSRRPTLFDFFVYNAIFFLAKEERDSEPSAPLPDRFGVDSPLLAPLEKFLAWKPETGAADSPDVFPQAQGLAGAVSLFQALLRFRLEDTANPEALAEADLYRIYWARQILVGEKDALPRVEQALREHLDRWKSLEVASDTAAELALFLRTVKKGQDAEDEIIAAAKLGVALHPQSDGAKRCRALLEEMAHAELVDFKTESVWNTPLPSISVRYRNLPNVHFRAIRVGWDFFRDFAPQRNDLSRSENAKLDKALDREPALQWTVALPPSKKTERVHVADAPKGLEPGFYLLAACEDASFDPEKRTVLFSAIQVSSLALVTYSDWDKERRKVVFPKERQREEDKKSRQSQYWRNEGIICGFVLDAHTGTPVPRARVTAWRNIRGDGGPVQVETDSDGGFSIRANGDYGEELMLLAEDANGGNKITNCFGFSFPSERGVHAYQYHWKSRYHTYQKDYVHLLTDRPLYRPGQTVHFKGVSFTRKDGKHFVCDNDEMTVKLTDPNYKVIAQMNLRTNANGGFSGSFSLPENLLGGHYSLQCQNSVDGQRSFHVEEYKRPKFEVSLAETASRVPTSKRKATVLGKVIANTGVPIAGAEVSYTVRCERNRSGHYWWLGKSSDSKQIDSGHATTDADGVFSVTFPVSAKANRYTYEIEAKATDSVGETRTTKRSIKVESLVSEAAIFTAEWQTPDAPVSVQVHVSAPSGTAPAQKSGTLKIYSLQQPEKVFRKPIDYAEGDPMRWSFQPNTAADSASGWHKETRGTEDALNICRYNQDDNDGDEDTEDDAPFLREKSPPKKFSAPRTWKNAALVASFPVAPDSNGKASVSAKLPVGMYRAVFTFDSSPADAPNAQTEIAVQSPSAIRAANRVPFSLTVAKAKLRPGDVFTALWSSGYEVAHARVDIRRDGKTLQSFWTDPAQTQQLISFPITEAYRGGFTVSVWQVSENILHEDSRFVEVPWDNKKLEISWERFRSTLNPGAKEVWTLRIKPLIADELADADAFPELAAVLYDASLDQLGATAFEQFGIRNQWARITPFRIDAGSVPRLYFSNYRNPNFTRLFVTEKEGKITYNNTREYKSWPPPLRHPAHTWRVSEMRHWYLKNNEGVINWDAKWWWRASPWLVRKSGRGLVSFFGGGAGGGMAGYLGSGGNDGNVGTQLSLEPSPQIAVEPPQVPPLDTVQARANLQETAFFFPAITADKNGIYRIEFTAPEALTRWKFMAFAHDAQMRSGVLCDNSIVTSKTLMVQPNPPRFVREGDEIEIAVKLTNKGNEPLTGRVRMNFSDAVTTASADTALGNLAPERPFSLAPHSEKSVAWRVRIPDGQAGIVYKAVAASAQESDGEEGILPVLSRRQLVTESRTFTFLPEAAPTASPKTLRLSPPVGVLSPDFAPESFLLQATSAPAWSALLSLPYLMEYEHECNEQLFNRFYANALSRHLLLHNPAVAEVFKQWRETKAAVSPLLQNAEVKNILLSETPWLRDVLSNGDRLRNLGQLFDSQRNADEEKRTLEKLSARQNMHGGWAWFDNGNANLAITRLIVAGFGRLQRAGISFKNAGSEYDPTQRILDAACASLDAWLVEEHKKMEGKTFELTPKIAHHLYARSFFAESGVDGSPAPFLFSVASAKAYDFFLSQAFWALAEHGNTKFSLQTRAHCAIALHRHFVSSRQGRWRTNTNRGAEILQALRKTLKTDAPELGAYWKESSEFGNFPNWYNAPVETHALLIEAFNEIAPDPALLASLQLWLLNQRRAAAWATTKSTADAVHALLLQPAKATLAKTPAAVAPTPKSKNAAANTSPAEPAAPPPLASLSPLALPVRYNLALPENAPPLQFALGGVPLKPSNVEAGTGYHREIVSPANVSKNAFRDVQVTRPAGATGVAWGSAIWRHFQPLDAVQTDASAPLKLRKSLFLKRNTERGSKLVPVSDAVSSETLTVGDTLVVRLEVTTPHEIDFVHLKDQRPSGTEPVNVFSGHQRTATADCYVSTKDAATHFFIDRLNAGTHRFEYEVHVQQRGSYQAGIAEVQSMYAPEFTTHTASTLLRVK